MNICELYLSDNRELLQISACTKTQGKSVIFGDDGYIIPPKAGWMTEAQYQLSLNVYYLAIWLEEQGFNYRWLNTAPRADEAKVCVSSPQYGLTVLVHIKATSDRKLLKWKIIHFLNTGEWNEENN